MTGQRFLEDVKVGDDLESRRKSASRTQLYLFSAATLNPHRIHYDPDYAKEEGHPDVLVHGPLQGAWLHQYVRDWVGPGGRIEEIAWENRKSALPERDLVFRGRIVEIRGDDVLLEVWEEDSSGGVLMPGTARVRLPRRGA